MINHKITNSFSKFLNQNQNFLYLDFINNTDIVYVY